MDSADSVTYPPVPPPLPPSPEIPSTEVQLDSTKVDPFWALALDTGAGSKMNLVVFRNVNDRLKKTLLDKAKSRILLVYNLKRHVFPIEVRRKLPETRRVLVEGHLTRIQQILINHFKKQGYDVDLLNPINYTPHIILKDENQLLYELKNEVDLRKDWLK